MYDIKPEAEGTDPVLVDHFAKQRQRTLDAIERGLCFCPNKTPHGCTDIAKKVLAELEQMWRDDEAFS